MRSVSLVMVKALEFSAMTLYACSLSWYVLPSSPETVTWVMSYQEPCVSGISHIGHELYKNDNSRVKPCKRGADTETRLGLYLCWQP